MSMFSATLITLNVVAALINAAAGNTAIAIINAGAAVFGFCLALPAKG